jgi:hypothetical protein
VSSSLTYPRLPANVARTLFQEQKDLSAEKLEGLSSTVHPRQEWHPTISPRVTRAELDRLRRATLDIAGAHGFPEPKLRGGHSLFDQQLAVYLWQQMQLVPAEAAVGGVWSFLSLVLLPDVAAWRYPDRNPARFIGRDTLVGTANRHVFGRLWARAYVFGPQLLPQLIEDNFEGIFGRPAFGGNIRVARAIASSMASTIDEHKVSNSQELLRDAMKRLLRLAGIVRFSGLDDNQLRELIDEVFATSVSATSISGKTMSSDDLAR